VGQPGGVSQLGKFPGWQTPPEHVWLAAQSVLLEQVHCIPLCVAVQMALGPHCAFEVHVVQA
jgi:hypothetical protein